MDNHCIIYSKKTNNGLLNLRTLDYGSDIYTHTLVIFNPDNKISYISLNLSFLFGIVTGINEKGIIVGERYCDYFLGWSDDKGVPFQFMFHDLLSNSSNIDDGEAILKKTHRMGNLHIGLTDIINNKSCIFDYCQSNIKNNMKINENSKIAYSVSPKEKNQFEKYKDKFNNAEELINNILPIIKSGELHVFIYYDGCIYVSVTTNYLQSYNNKFYKLHLTDLFNS
jgi:predicted choloylglycine hydrolase